jgi:mannosyltransferase
VAQRTLKTEPADRAAERPPRPRLARSAWWLLPPLVMAVLGGWAVSRHYGLWYDELYTAEVSQLAPGDLLAAIVRGEGTIPYLRDAPPSYNGPYYLLTHAWLTVTGLQADEWGLRLLSLLASLAAVAAFTAAVRRLAGATVALLAGLALAANPFVVQYSAEGRGYALALLAVALAALGLVRWLDGRPRGLLLYGLAAAAAGLAHWFALLAVAGFALSAVILRRRQAARLVLVTVVATVPVLALVATALLNGVGASGAEWLRGVGAAVPQLVMDAWAGRNPWLLVLTLVLAVTGLFLGGRHNREISVVGAAWFGVPVAAVTLLELVRPVFVDRYLLTAVPGLALLVALGVARLPRRLVPLAAGVLVTVSVWATLVEVGRGPKDDVRGAVDYVAAHHRQGEPVVAPARWDALGVDHFTRRDHPELVPEVVLAPPAVPQAPSLWVIRRWRGGVKGDDDRVTAFEREVGARGLRVASERRFDGRYADTLVQRWVSPR